MAVTSSNLNRFSKFFHHWKETPHLKYGATLPWGISKFKFVDFEENANKKCHINQLSFYSYQKEKHEQTLNVPSLLFSRLIKGVQTVKKHKK